MLKQAMIAAALLVGSASANAAIITVSGDFTATDWTVYFGAPAAPIDPIYLSYSATFDDSINYDGDTTILNIGSTNIPYALTFSFNHFSQDIVIATSGNSGLCNHPEQSFCAFVSDLVTGTPYFVEQSPAGGGGWVANTITGGSPNGGVPEPAAWALLITGFGLVGAAARTRRRMAAIQ